MSAEPERHLRAVPDDDPSYTPPHDDQAEQIALGAAMLSPDAADVIAAKLAVDDFYQPKHGAVFSAIVALRIAGEPVEPTAVAASLARSGDLARVGGTPYLHDLIAGVPVTASAGWYADRIAECAQRRRVIVAGMHVTEVARDPQRDLAEVCNRAHAILNDATAARRGGGGTSWREMIGPLTEGIEAAARGDGVRALSTGLVDLDKVLAGGLRPGQLATVAGRPGMGKSVLAVDLARHAAFRLNLPVVLFSLEMSREELGQRILAAEASIDLSIVQSGTDNETAWARITEVTGRTAEAPLHIDDSATIDLAEIRAVARQQRQRHGALGLVVVDYLQLLHAARRYDNRVAEVSELSRGLKLLAKELQCPIVAASQLNRAAEARADRRPQLSDLRESGSVEQDSDIVILLHRPDYYDPESPRSGEIDLIIAKNRNGAQGVITAAAQLWFTRIADMAIC